MTATHSRLRGYEFDRHPLTRVRGAGETSEPPFIELQTAFDQGWLIEMLVDGLSVRMTPAQAHALGVSLSGLAARVVFLDAETQAKGH